MNNIELAKLLISFDGKTFTKIITVEEGKKLTVEDVQRRFQALSRWGKETILKNKLKGYSDFSVISGERDRIANGGKRFEELELDEFTR